MDEQAQAQAVWRSAQKNVVLASAALLDAAEGTDTADLEENFEFAVEMCSMAKQHYDIIRAEQQPVADDVTLPKLMRRPRAG